MNKYSYYYYSKIQNNTLKIYMSNVYIWMSSGLFLTSLVSWLISKTQLFLKLIFFNKSFIFLIFLAQITTIFLISQKINELSHKTAIFLFTLHSILTGITISSIFLIYTYNSIATTFFISSTMFGIMSIIGCKYKKDLTDIGNISIMLLIGASIATIINFWIKSNFLIWIISYLGILIFCILTAWDTQKIKEIGNNIIINNNEQLIRYSILGALMLYLDFINLYTLIIQILGIKINDINLYNDDENNDLYKNYYDENDY